MEIISRSNLLGSKDRYLWINFFILKETKPNNFIKNIQGLPEDYSVFIEEDYFNKPIKCQTIKDVIKFLKKDFKKFSYLLYGGSGEVDGFTIICNETVIYKELSPDTPCQTGNSAMYCCFLNSEGKINVHVDKTGIYYYIGSHDLSKFRPFKAQEKTLILVDKYNILEQVN